MPDLHPCCSVPLGLDGMEILPETMTGPMHRSTPVASHLRQLQLAESHFHQLESQVRIAQSVRLVAFLTRLDLVVVAIH